MSDTERDDQQRASEFSGASLADSLGSDSRPERPMTAQEEKAAIIAEKERAPFRPFEAQIDQTKLAESPGIPESMRDWITRLPETLRFESPVTLLVGDNGAGKTQFAKAMADALVAERNRPLTVGEEDRVRLGRGRLILRDEPAGELVDAITVTDPGSRSDKFGFSMVIEGAEMMYVSRKWAEEQARMARDEQLATVSDGGYTHRLSSRQLFEQTLEDVKKTRIDGNRLTNAGDAVVVLDEPEQGLSPGRQLELPNVVTHFLPQSEALFVPTNNLALYLSDLPRIDIDHPERGVFRPSQYNEQGRVEWERAA